MKNKTIIAPESKIKKVEIPLNEDDVISNQSSHIFDKLSAHRRAMQRYELKQQFTNPVEEIAQDKVFVSQAKFPGADEAFPLETQAMFRFVTQLYPNAKGGPLYVDKPRNETEAFRAYERQRVMKKLGLRHIVVESDSSLEHLLTQLGEL